LENILSMEQIFRPGNTIQIIFSEYIGNVKSFTATVKNLLEEGLYISTEAEDTGNLFDAGAEITIQYESPEGTQYLFSTYKIAKVIKDASILICAKPWKTNSSLQYRYFGPQVETPWKVHSASLRRYFRMKMDLPFYYRIDEVIYIGRLIDLSVGGLFAVVNPDSRLLLDSQLSFKLQLPEIATLEIQGEIVRSQTIDRTKLGIAISFVNISEDHRNEITRYLQSQ
jgi:c-di-GMP-binding flagellar brake protein YcgR